MNMHMTNSDVTRLRRMINGGVTDLATLQKQIPVHVKRIREVIAHCEEVAAAKEAEEAEAAKDVKPVSVAAKAAAEAKAKKAAAAKAKKAAKPNPIS